MKRIHILISDDMHADATEEADRSGVSMSELWRRAWESTYGKNAPTVVEITHKLGRRPGRPLDGL